jgi:hypothetical protein
MAVENKNRARPLFDGLTIKFGEHQRGGMIWQTTEKEIRE